MIASIKAIGSLTALKLAGAILGIAYMIVQVRYFGTSHDIEIFFAAQSVVYVVTSLTQSGQLTEVFLPVYLKLRNFSGPKVAHQCYSVLINRLSIFILGILSLAFLAAPYLMDVFIPGFSLESKESATLFFRACLPFILLQINAGILNTILNAEGVYGRAEAATSINHISSIVALLCFYNTFGIWTLLLSSYVGMAVQIIVLCYNAQKAGLKYYFVWRSRDFDHRQFFGTTFYTFTYTFSTQILNWAIVASTSFLPQGAFAVFKYVEKLVPKVIGVFIDPFTTVYFTRIANKISSTCEKGAFKIKIIELQEYSLLFGLLIFTLAVACGKEVLFLIWGTEKFSSTDVSLGYFILVAFCLALAFQMFYTINRKLSVALGWAKYNYGYQSIAQLLAAGSTFLLVFFLAIPGLLASIIFSRALLIFMPMYINSRMSPDYYGSPSRVFFKKYLLLLVSIPFLVFALKALFFPLMLVETNMWSSLWQSVLWATIGLCLFILCLPILNINLIYIYRRYSSKPNATV